MMYETFMASTQENTPLDGTEKVLEALWYEKKGDWDQGHRIAQQIATAEGSAVHAYLHRREGDAGNARYWYAKAGREESKGRLDDEWDSLVKEFTV